MGRGFGLLAGAGHRTLDQSQSRRTTSQLSSQERSKVTDALIAQVGALTKANNELYAELKRLQSALNGLATFDREQDRRIDAIERGAAVLSAWVRRPWRERVRSKLGF